jgi:hypothetical protein
LAREAATLGTQRLLFNPIVSRKDLEGTGFSKHPRYW